MSLHESIDDLRGVAKRLEAATFAPDMNALKIFVDELGTFGKDYVPTPEDLEKLLAKFLRGERDFSRRELKNLPYIIYDDAINFDGAKEILWLLRLMDFTSASPSPSHLRRVVSVYLTNYDDSNKTELLRRRLNVLRGVDNVRLRKIFSAREELFGNDRFANMTRLFARTMSVNGAFGELGLGDFFKTAKFIQAALTNFFRADVPLEVQFKILDELDAEYDTYKNIFAAVADALILTVARAGVGKRKCLAVFYNRLGDPRFGNGRGAWNEVSARAREIFLRWLAEDDLELFFRITRETLRGDFAALNMWNAREKFWRKYLPRIGNTWVVLGNEARKIARRLEDKRTHGALLGKLDADKSGFLFQIGGFIFAEWSHDGALRVYPARRVQDYIGSNFYKSDMMGVPVDYRQVHIGAWQDKVRAWIQTNC